ncbi:hypothetical protein M0R45_015183 [Rubus argutus]|uniref:Uncharacterized protein n=1 Tax=Rubus argutus TaxID=59490 RepID=A0AAW1XS76_RUBAR
MHVARSNQSPDIAWEHYIKEIDNARFSVPSRLSEADVSAKYLEWWNESVSVLKTEVSYHAKIKESKVHGRITTEGYTGPLTSGFWPKERLVSEGRNEDNDSLVPPGFPPKFRMEAGCSMDKDGLTLSESLKHNNLDTRTCGDIEKLSCPVQNLASSIAESSVDTLKSERLEAGGSMDEDKLTLSELFKNYKKDKNVETRTCGDSEKLSAQIQNLTCSIAESSVDMLKSERSMTEDMVNIVLIGGCKAKGNLTNVMGVMQEVQIMTWQQTSLTMMCKQHHSISETGFSA